MTAAKKTASKVTPLAKKAKSSPTKAKTPEKELEKLYSMPKEVSEWIEQATSRIRHMTHEIERLKADNKALRAANKVMEQRVLGMSLE